MSASMEPSVVEVNQEMLRKQIMVNQFCNQVGCTPELATEILQSAHWQIEVGFSLFFQGYAVSATSTTSSGVHYNDGSSFSSMDSACSSNSTNSLGTRMSYVCVPTNTPATPPALPDTLAAFAQMRASSPEQARIVDLQKS